MKNYSWLLLLALLVFGGCARRYTITLNNGSQVGSKNKPRLENGVYVFKDALGRPAYVPATRVKEIAPASRGTSKNSSTSN